MSDFFLPFVLSAAADSPVVAAFQSVMIRAQQSLDWIPNLTSESASLFYDSPPKYPRLNPRPAGLTAEQQQQWSMIVEAMQPLTTNVLRGEMQNARIEGDRLASNVAFWDKVMRVTQAVATAGYSEVAPLVKEKWAELQSNIAEWKKTRELALRIADHPKCPQDKAEKLRAKIAELDQSVAGKVTSTAAQIPGMDAAVQSEGLNGLEMIAALATIKTAVVIAGIAAVVAILVYCISSIKGLIKDLGLDALGDTLRDTQKALGPFLGVAILGLIGFVVYKKYSSPKPAQPNPRRLR